MPVSLKLLRALAPGSICLHSTRVCGCSEPSVFSGRCSQTTLRPFLAHLDDMAATAQILDNFRRDPAFKDKNTRPR